ncbi:MAG TPA: GntR family transcriptional regulator, partial [Streptosporangiaceae bacterium]|nr:GntR family transcriptional regulator [Streptosporangiaceae bacterium]
MDLHLELPRDPAAGDVTAPSGNTGPSGGVRARLEAALRDAVRSGRLGPGVRLPSSRALAADLGLARNTVAEAYGQLVAEGWLTARQGSGTRVAERAAASTVPADVPSLTSLTKLTSPPGHTSPGELTRPPRYTLKAGSPDLSAFPRAAWLAAGRRAFTAAPSHALGYGHPQGRPE